MTIRFADYYDEYPFEFSIDLPGVNYDPLVNWQDASADSEWLGERAQVALGCFSASQFCRMNISSLVSTRIWTAAALPGASPVSERATGSG